MTNGKFQPNLENWRTKTMNYPMKTTRVRGLLAAALVLGCVFSTVNYAAAQNVTPPPTPIGITPPEGNQAFLLGRGVGTQGYVCLPVGTTAASWTVNGARPEATLFTKFFGQDVQIITHFLSPDANPNANAANPLPFGNATWQSSFDSSKVWAKQVNLVVAGTDPSCPHNGSIACLLLQSVGNLQGPTGGKLLAKTTYIQRLNTIGGLAPATGCAVPGDVGHQALVPYSADYFFFRAED
jgi:hypothetical protein